MMTLLREALSWNYVLVTAVISSLLAQFTKVILNLIILGKFIPERHLGLHIHYAVTIDDVLKLMLVKQGES